MSPRTSPTPSSSSARRSLATSPARCSQWRAASTSSCTDTAERVEFGVTHWSGAVGPYIWHDFDRERTQAELAHMSRAGARTVRAHLPWDVFMPTPGEVPRQRLRDVEAYLAICERESLAVIPVLFAQSFADCVMLPAWAIDVSAPRAGVRVLTDAVVQPGGPRDQYTDAAMLEASLLWLETLLGAFAGHPAISAWDLGHDPATTLRPRRIAHLEAWANALSGSVRDRGERCLLSLAAADVLSARGVRLQAVTKAVDVIGLVLEPAHLQVLPESDDAAASTFVVQLAQRLAGEAPLLAHVVASGDFERCVAGCVDSGCVAVVCAAWSNVGPRAAGVAPFDRHPDLGQRGLVDEHCEPTAFADAWWRITDVERERHPRSPWPESLDADDYYAHLPESAHELYAEWTAVERDIPGMLR